MLAPAIFGISNSGINLAIDLIILFLVVIWLSLVYWTYADARRRIADPMLIGCSTVASLFPFVGTLVYMIVRPPEYLEDVRERELEIQAAEARLAELGYQLCPHCDYEVEKDFLRCPICMRTLRDPCPACGKPLDPNWKICPFCEADLGAPAPTPRRTRRRRDAVLDRQGGTGSGYGESSSPPSASDRGGTSPPTYAPGQSERGSRPGAYAPTQGERGTPATYAPSQGDGSGTTPATYAPSQRDRGRSPE
jgi:RNA polymerase subunit RPABC4/transcription elongation factor Spt4